MFYGKILAAVLFLSLQLNAQTPIPSLPNLAEKHLSETCETFRANIQKSPEYAASVRPQLKAKMEKRCARFEAAKKSAARNRTLVSILREEWQDNAKRLLVLAYVDQKVNFESEKKFDLNFERLAPMLKGAYKEYESPGLPHPYILAVPPNCAKLTTPKSTVSTLDLADASAFAQLQEAEKKTIRKFLANVSVKCKDPTAGYTFYALNTIGSSGELDVWAIDEKKEIRHIKDGNR